MFMTVLLMPFQSLRTVVKIVTDITDQDLKTSTNVKLQLVHILLLHATNARYMLQNFVNHV